jgi:hypothetical protein
MLRRLIQILLALIVGLAAAVPVSVLAMPMPPGMTGMAVQQHCPICPHHTGSGATPDKMPPCEVPACAGAVATLPSPALLPGRVFLRAGYLIAPPVRWTGAPLAPDPFPPRPIVLV